MKKLLVIFLVLALLLCACGETDPKPTVTDPTTKPTTASPTNPATTPATEPTTPATEPTMSSEEKEIARDQQTLDTSDLFSDRDLEGAYEGKVVYIDLNGSTVSFSGSGVTIKGNAITITDEGTYLFTGTLDDGMVIVDVGKNDKVQLVLNGASITCATSAAIYVRKADKVFITTLAGTENALINGGSFVAIDENSIDATIFSKDDLTLNGFGSLTVECPAGHGIVSKDELTIAGGTYNITASGHGINGKDNVCISSGSFNIAAGKDGIQADNADDVTLGFLYVADGNFQISAEGDGLSASSLLQIDGGTFGILAGGGSVNGSKTQSDNWGGFGGGSGGGERGGGGSGGGSNSRNTTGVTESSSMKGIKSAGNMYINGGTFVIDSADDSVHSDINCVISGGSFEIQSGDDGIHAEEKLDIYGGTINITESYEGLEALHVTVHDGDIRLVASDDGINAAGGTDQSGMGGRDQGSGGGENGSIIIGGGNLYINAGGDGIDANGTFEVSGGYTVLCGPTQGDTSVLDYDASGTITGGTFIGTGASGFGQSFTRAQNQGYLYVRVNASANTKITVTDAAGNVILDHTPDLGFNVFVFSSPDVRSGQTYTVTVGNSSSSYTAK